MNTLSQKHFEIVCGGMLGQGSGVPTYPNSGIPVGSFATMGAPHFVTQTQLSVQYPSVPGPGVWGYDTGIVLEAGVIVEPTNGGFIVTPFWNG